MIRLIVGYTAIVICAMCCYVVVSKRVVMPLLMECGWFSLAIGMLSVADGVFYERECSMGAIAVRWAFNGTGVFLIILSLFLSSRRNR